MEKLTESNSYLAFSKVRFIKGMILNINTITTTIFKAISSDAYMSTRISPKKEFNWTVAGNTNIAKERAKELINSNIKVLDPTTQPAPAGVSVLSGKKGASTSGHRSPDPSRQAKRYNHPLSSSDHRFILPRTGRPPIAGPTMYASGKNRGDNFWTVRPAWPQLRKPE